jgi:hypothetical protein
MPAAVVTGRDGGSGAAMITAGAYDDDGEETSLG